MVACGEHHQFDGDHRSGLLRLQTLAARDANRPTRTSKPGYESGSVIFVAESKGTRGYAARQGPSPGTWSPGGAK